MHFGAFVSLVLFCEYYLYFSTHIFCIPTTLRDFLVTMSHHKVKPLNGKRAKRMSVEFEEPADQDYINTLNDDCLSRIFMYLPIRDKFVVQAVCKRWRENPDVIWRDFRILDSTSEQLTQVRKTERVFKRIFQLCGGFLQQLKLVHYVGSWIMPIIANYCHNLKKIEIQLPREDKKNFKWYPEMEKLEYFKFRGNHNHFHKNLFTTLPPKHLTELHLSARYDYSRILKECDLFHGAVDLLDNSPKLSALSLEGFSLGVIMCGTIHGKSTLTYLSIARCNPSYDPSYTELLASHLIKLKRFNLMKTICAEYITKMVKTFQELKYLNLSDGWLLGDDDIYPLRGLPQLEELVLNRNPRITDEPLSEMFHLKKLECEGCESVGNDGIITLMRYAPNLEYLNLACSGVTGQVLTVAMEVMRQRTNRVALRMFVDSRLRSSYNQDILPALLILEEHPNRSHDIHYDSDYPDNN